MTLSTHQSMTPTLIQPITQTLGAWEEINVLSNLFFFLDQDLGLRIFIGRTFTVKTCQQSNNKTTWS